MEKIRTTDPESRFMRQTRTEARFHGGGSRSGRRMVDNLSKRQRSQLMARIRGRDTRPERALRLALRRKKIPYRSYPKVAGVTVDLILPTQGIAIFVHGCFWHGCPRHYTAPRTRPRFWKDKLASNRRRDLVQQRRVMQDGWQVAVVWEHSLRPNGDQVVDRLSRRRRRRLTKSGQSPTAITQPPTP